MKNEFVVMYGNNWKNVEGISQTEVDNLEKNVQLKLPNELKEVIKNCSGSRPSQDFYEGANIEVSIGYILPVKPDKKRGDVLRCYNRLIETYSFPEHIFPFATDKGHANFICLDLKSKEVVYCLTDVKNNNVRILASDIMSFIYGLSDSVY